jgi:hypothetical protein
MSLRFMDGFDHYATADITKKWTAAGNEFTIETGSSGRFNGFCLLASAGGGGQNCYKAFESQDIWIVGFAVKLSRVDTAARILSLNDDASIQVEVQLTAGAKLCIMRNGTLLATGTTALVADTWYYLQFKATIADAISADSCILKIGSVTEINLAAGTDTRATSNLGANRVALWHGAAPVSLRFDDVYVLDGTGSAPYNDFLGDVRVETLWANGAGTHTDWTPSAGANYQCVDETQQNGDTDYVSTATVGDIDTYNFGPLSTTPPAIFAVQTVITHRKDDAGSPTIAPYLKAGSTNHEGTAVAVLDSYSMTVEIFEQDPATSAAWTPSAVNALEAGVKLVS